MSDGGQRRSAWAIAADIRASIDPETGEVDGDRLACLEGELRDKVDAYHVVLTEWDGDAAAIKAEVARLRERLALVERRGERLRERLLAALKIAEVRKVETSLVTARVQSGRDRVVLDVEPDALPAAYVRTKIEADKKAIGDALKDGVEIHGARLEMGEDTLVLR